MNLIRNCVAAGALIFLCICAGIGLATPVKADGYESYKDPEPSYRYSHRPQKVSAGRIDRRNISSQEMAYLRCVRENTHRRADGRRARDCFTLASRPRYTAATVSRYDRDYDRPVRKRYAETRYVRSDADYRGGRECKPAIKVTSKPMATEHRACEEAKKIWSMQAGNVWSGAYNDWSNARVILVKPKPAHYGAWRDVCTVVARPCRED